jgi:hypothetical protein
MSEALTQALHTTDFTIASLREALAQASAVEALLLMPMIGTAAQLHSDIAALASAKAEA